MAAKKARQRISYGKWSALCLGMKGRDGSPVNGPCITLANEAVEMIRRKSSSSLVSIANCLISQSYLWPILRVDISWE